VREITDPLSQEYEAFRTRALSGSEVAYLFIDTVYEPVRRWGTKTGVLCVWAIGIDGRKVLRSLSTANSESYENCLEVRRDLVKRGVQTPVTITTDGAVGLTKAIEAMGTKSLRIRWWFHKMQNLQPKVPPQPWPAFKALGVDMRDAPSGAEPRGGGKRLWPSIPSTFLKPVVAYSMMVRRVAITSRAHPAINSTCAPRTSPNGRLRRSGGAPRSSPNYGMKAG